MDGDVHHRKKKKDAHQQLQCKASTSAQLVRSSSATTMASSTDSFTEANAAISKKSKMAYRSTFLGTFALSRPRTYTSQLGLAVQLRPAQTKKRKRQGESSVISISSRESSFDASELLAMTKSHSSCTSMSLTSHTSRSSSHEDPIRVRDRTVSHARSVSRQGSLELEETPTTTTKPFKIGRSKEMHVEVPLVTAYMEADNDNKTAVTRSGTPISHETSQDTSRPGLVSSPDQSLLRQSQVINSDVEPPSPASIARRSFAPNNEIPRVGLCENTQTCENTQIKLSRNKSSHSDDEPCCKVDTEGTPSSDETIDEREEADNKIRNGTGLKNRDLMSRYHLRPTLSKRAADFTGDDSDFVPEGGRREIIVKHPGLRKLLTPTPKTLFASKRKRIGRLSGNVVISDSDGAPVKIGDEEEVVQDSEDDRRSSEMDEFDDDLAPPVAIETDTSDDLAYHDSAHQQMRKERTAFRKIIGSSSLTPMSELGGSNESSSRKRLYMPSHRKSASQVPVRTIEVSSSDNSDSDVPLIYSSSDKRHLSLRPSPPQFALRRRRKASPSVVQPSPTFEEKPASYTRSRTGGQTSDFKQCHQCEVFHAKRRTLHCLTCDRGMCDRCICELYHDFPFYCAILAYLSSSFSKSLSPDERELKKSKHRSIERESIQNELVTTLFIASGMELDHKSCRTKSIQEAEPHSADVSVLDFQCPVCKHVCKCANCLRGPLPKPGSVLNKVPSKRRIESPVRTEEAKVPVSESISMPSPNINTAHPKLRRSRNLASTSVPTDPEKAIPSTLKIRLRVGDRPKRLSSMRIGNALATAAAVRVALDEETEYVPVVAARKTPTTQGPKNVVPRLGSPPRLRYSASMAGAESREEAFKSVMMAKSARVRLATKVGQQLGKSPASLLQAADTARLAGGHSISTSPTEPVFTLSDGTMSNEIVFNSELMDDLPPSHAPSLSHPFTALIHPSSGVSSSPRLLPTISYEKHDDDDDENIIPEFAMSSAECLPDLDQDSPSDTVTTLSTSSLASPANDGKSVFEGLTIESLSTYVPHKDSSPPAFRRPNLDVPLALAPSPEIGSSVGFPRYRQPPHTIISATGPPTTNVNSLANPQEEFRGEIDLSSFLNDDAFANMFGGTLSKTMEFGFGNAYNDLNNIDLNNITSIEVLNYN